MNETADIVTKDYLKNELQQLRAEIRLEIQQLRTEFQQLRTEFQQLRTEIQTNQRWNVGLIFGLYAANIGTLIAILLKQ